MLRRLLAVTALAAVLASNSASDDLFEGIQAKKIEEEYDNLELLAQIVQAEAGNQGFIGKCLVADVVLNRVDSDDFPDSIEGVVSAPGQFNPYSSGSIWTVVPDEETYRAIQHELEDRCSYEVLYFRTKRYHSFGEPWGNVRDHYFSKKGDK